jgi:hypothetical protein
MNRRNACALGALLTIAVGCQQILGIEELERGGGPDVEFPDADVGNPAECQLFPQGGCASGTSCRVNASTGELFCSTTISNGRSGDSCTSSSVCAAGFECAGSVCTEYCTFDSQCDGSDGLCFDDIFPSPSSNVGLCNHLCNPVTGSGCDVGLRCLLGTESAAPMRDFTVCTTDIGSGGQGDSCTTHGDCGIGMLCVNIQNVGTQCAKFCAITGNDCTSIPGTSCLQLSGNPTVEGVQYGFCN